MNILFRTDSSSTIGTGHIMRDLVLAEQFKDANVIFATQELSGNINHKIEEKDYTIEILNSNNIEELIDIIKKYSIEMIVIDHYGIDHDYEKALKDSTGITIFVLDDTYEKHYCDILLNHNIYAESSRYKNLVPEHCELRCGANFTLLREEFKSIKTKQKKPSQEIKNVFLAMGGADHSNLNIEILKVLENFPNIHANVVTTNANQYLNELQEYVVDKENVTLYINTDHIAKLMNEADLAIVTPSVTVNEIVYMAVPFIAIQTASNQSYMTKYLAHKNYSVLENFDANELFRLLNDLISSDVSNIIDFNHGKKKMTSLFIITGTTQGLGKALLNSLKTDNIILTINRHNIRYQQKNLHNLCLDLSNIDLTKINNFEIELAKLVTKDITKVVFINNAFSMGQLAKIDSLDNSEIINSFNINIVSSFLLIKSFISVSKDLNIDKCILNISSGAAQKAIDGWSIYCASKSSLEMLIESIKVEYNDYKCFNIDPGVMDTNMQSTIRSFTDGINNEYFVGLYENNNLKEPIEIANYIIKEYI